MGLLSNGISIGSAVFAQLTVVPNTQTACYIYARRCYHYYSNPTETTLACYSSRFKLACLVYNQSLAGQTPTYLTSDIHLLYCRLRHPSTPSTSERICVVPRTHNSFGDISFSAASPRVWNALPSYLRKDMNYRHFKRALKGHVFRS